MTKSTTTKTEKKELAKLGENMVSGQKGSLKKISISESTAIIFCSMIRSEGGMKQ